MILDASDFQTLLASVTLSSWLLPSFPLELLSSSVRLQAFFFTSCIRILTFGGLAFVRAFVCAFVRACSLTRWILGLS
jgi:hypothetical protein